MEKAASLQRVNQQQRLAEWSQRVEACRRSGLSVDLCPTNGGHYLSCLKRFVRRQTRAIFRISKGLSQLFQFVFSQTGFRNFRYKSVVDRALNECQVFRSKPAKFLHTGPHSIPADNDGFPNLSPQRVRNPNHTHILNCTMAKKCRLNFRREDILSVGDIHVLQSAHYVEKTILILLRHPDNVLRIDGVFHVHLRFDMIRRILTIGIPNGLENGLFQAGKLVVLSLITTFGTNAVAANAIANSIAGVVNVPGLAIGLAMITVVGQCMGAGDDRQAVAYTKKLVGLVYLSMGILSILMFCLAGPLCSLFALTPEATAMAVEVLRWCAVFDLLIWPLAFTLPNALRASGDVMFTMAVSMGSMFLFRIASSYFLSCDWGMGLGLLGVWLGMIIDWGVRSLIFVLRFLSGRWKSHKVI